MGRASNRKIQGKQPANLIRSSKTPSSVALDYKAEGEAEHAQLAEYTTLRVAELSHAFQGWVGLIDDYEYPQAWRKESTLAS